MAPEEIGPDDPQRVDPVLAGACGTYCGACLAHRGEVAGSAARLLDTIRRQGFLSLARRIEPADAERIDAFLDVLDRIGRTPPCPGCGLGGGVPRCPVRTCAKGRGHATCAGCVQLDACTKGEGERQGRKAPRDAERRRRSDLRKDGEPPFPFTASDFLGRLTRKYGGWNRENLDRIGSVGLDEWLREVSRDPAFRTIERKIEEDVFGDG